jgi:hypothetical protein
MKKIKVIVKKAFRDRYTGIKHKSGDRMTITEARFREIKRSGDYVEIEGAKQPVQVAAPSAPNESKK